MYLLNCTVNYCLSLNLLLSANISWTENNLNHIFFLTGNYVRETKEHSLNLFLKALGIFSWKGGNGKQQRKYL